MGISDLNGNHIGSNILEERKYAYKFCFKLMD